MSDRICPVKGCGRALGTTRNGDPYLMYPKHFGRLTNTQMGQLWRTYKSWKRFERQLLKMRAEGNEVAPAFLNARAEAVSRYIDVRNECIAAVAY